VPNRGSGRSRYMLSAPLGPPSNGHSAPGTASPGTPVSQAGGWPGRAVVRSPYMRTAPAARPSAVPQAAPGIPFAPNTSRGAVPRFGATVNTGPAGSAGAPAAAAPQRMRSGGFSTGQAVPAPPPAGATGGRQRDAGARRPR
jgi:hypothetical protein